MTNTTDADWSEDEYQNEVKLAERFDVVEIAAEDDAALDAYDSYDAYWNDVEQGRYDDDPSPYDGNYSEE